MELAADRRSRTGDVGRRRQVTGLRWAGGGLFIQIAERFRQSVRTCLEHEPLMPGGATESDGQTQLKRHVESWRCGRRAIEGHTRDHGRSNGTNGVSE